MDNSNDNKGVLENLDMRIRQLMSESKDPEYTEYLQKMAERLRQQKYQVDLLKAEFERSYGMYLRRMESMSAETMKQQDTQEEKPVIEETVVETNAEQTIPPKKRNTEFTIGAAVLSIVGGGFILAALVTLGMTFADGLIKGICLYALAMVFLLASELYLYRKLPMLGATFSAIGIGGLYLSTAVNYLGLHNFNLWVTLSITLVITFFVVLLSRKRDSVLYRIIGMIAGYMCFFTIREGITDTEFIVVSGMILLMNVLCTLLPVRKARTEINITHMSVNTFFSVWFVVRALSGCGLSEWPVLIFVISSIIVMHFLLVAQFYYFKRRNTMECYAGVLAAYYISAIFYVFITCALTYNLIDMHDNNWYAYGAVIALGVIGICSMLALRARKCGGYGHIYTFINLGVFTLVGCTGEEWGIVISLLVLLVVAKLICYKMPALVYRINDIVITVLLCILVTWYDGYYVYPLLAGLVFGILMIKYWQTFYEIILTAFLVIFTANHLPMILQLPVVVGILLVGILMFNNVKRWQGKHIVVYNIVALIAQAICFLRLSSAIYESEYITYLCMLVFGLATIILTLQEKYHMNCRGKYLILAIFLTYMAFILRVDIPVINSILLMVIALVCVGIGFAADNKSVRIYGLVLALVVCGKLVLYDFFGAATIQKTILFFVVGVLTLIIASIYIVLEKKNNS